MKVDTEIKEFCSVLGPLLIFLSLLTFFAIPSPGVMPELYPAGPSSPLRGAEVLRLRVSALACSAYVGLCLSDFSSALRHAELLLVAHPKMPGVYK